MAHLPWASAVELVKGDLLDEVGDAFEGVDTECTRCTRWAPRRSSPPRIVVSPDGRGLLRLRAEMLLPGQAWLEFRIEPEGAGAVIHQRALFAPKGLLGRLYWWVLVPFHGPIFSATVRALARQAERGGPSEERPLAA